MFPRRQDIRYAIPGKMDSQYQGSRFPGKVDGQYPNKRGGQLPPEMDPNYMGRRRDYVGGEPPRYYGPSGNLPRQDYERDSKDYYQMREDLGKQGNPRMLPDQRAGDPRSGDPRSGDPRQGDPRSGDPLPGDPRSGDPRYPPGYRPMGGDSRPPGYPPRREEEDFNRPPPNEMDYQSRRGGPEFSSVRKFDGHDEYPDEQRPIDDSSRYGDPSHFPGFSLRNEKEREEALPGNNDEHSDPRLGYMQTPSLSQQSSTRSPYNPSDYDKEDHRAAFRGKPSFNYGDYGTVQPNRPAEISRTHGNSRDYEGGNFGYNKNTPSGEDPGEFVSMATDKENSSETRVTTEEDVKPSVNENLEFLKSNEVQSHPNDLYVVEEEIPIVTRSDDIANIPEET